MRIILLPPRFANVPAEYSRGSWCRRRLNQQFRRNSFRSTTKKIETVVELESLLSKPTWAIQSLLPESTPENRHEDINPQSLRDLLRRSGLQFPKDAEEEAKMLSDLQRQLVFVDHVQDVDTDGVEPLNRIGEYGEELQWDDVQIEPEELRQTVKDKLSIREHMERTFFYVKDREDK
ncbi:hypothetical protein V1517DRAFT_318922 [Lipomyces orientalis]|uniref:Uncharacterized protein n=1 Tax=Lipomyces orientalis TaxID=1233043 RepID=A0ACC3TS49_9ASCO